MLFYYFISIEVFINIGRQGRAVELTQINSTTIPWVFNLPIVASTGHLGIVERATIARRLKPGSSPAQVSSLVVHHVVQFYGGNFVALALGLEDCVRKRGFLALVEEASRYESEGWNEEGDESWELHFGGRWLVSECVDW